MSLFSIITKTAKIGGEILSAIGSISTSNNPDKKPPYVNLGDVTWVYDPTTGKTEASNLKPENPELLVSYSSTSNDGVLATRLQPITFRHTYDATDDLYEFSEGDISIQPMPGSSDTSTNFGFREILCYAGMMFAIRITLTKSFSFEKTNTGFKIESPTVFEGVYINYQDKQGNKFTIDGKVDKNKFNNNSNNSLEIPFPEGSSKELPFSNLSITIKMPIESMIEITRESRKRLRSVNTVPILQSFLPSETVRVHG
ncbi:MAG: hypothetical protein WBA41_20210 [Rivularia sp. (in: cyanobacteria)]